jgi:hypothetical protein
LKAFEKIIYDEEYIEKFLHEQENDILKDFEIVKIEKHQLSKVDEITRGSTGNQKEMHIQFEEEPQKKDNLNQLPE